ncbi:hypothetical protein DBV39_01295 [Orrella marina]|uniref:Uncharacterized protein n=1 Tax=Orrella marina TaxID=2163011 RepID=A0A2R4XFL2_9BURK|nr:hypothetical protein DBV39_01295 [Orrella marina]
MIQTSCTLRRYRATDGYWGEFDCHCITSAEQTDQLDKPLQLMQFDSGMTCANSGSYCASLSNLRCESHLDRTSRAEDASGDYQQLFVLIFQG